jgi:hypothetical protein
MAQRDKKSNVINRDPIIRDSTKEYNQDNEGQAEEVREKFMDGPDEPGDNVQVRHPNRNTDKPSIDKPPYS